MKYETRFSEQVCSFFERLERLDPGERARFKRYAGKQLAESRSVLGLFYRILPPDVPSYQHEAFFLAATLYPLADGGAEGNFGESLRRAKAVKNAKGLDRRMEVLLNADETQLPFRLRQAIRFLQSCRVRVNWPALLQDLLSWSHPKHMVQRRWAQSYFSE
jgi:CRISPR type I-E-associated protein CasB/Cse2